MLVYEYKLSLTLHSICGLSLKSENVYHILFPKQKRNYHIHDYHKIGENSL